MNEADLPHLLAPIAESRDTLNQLDLPATREMRAWMEIVTESLTFDGISLILAVRNFFDQDTDLTIRRGYVQATASITITLADDPINESSVTVHHDSALGDVMVTDGIGTDILLLQGTVISYRYKRLEGWVRGA